MKSPLYYKKIEYADSKEKTRTKTDENSAPVLYAKLICSYKSNKILTLFKSKRNRNADPFEYLNQYCKVKVALIFEGLHF